MGMRDESWCSGCGTGITYTEDESAMCGQCSEEYTKSDILTFVKGRIAELTELRSQYEAEGDYELDDYSAGAIDAYDIIRMKLEN